MTNLVIVEGPDGSGKSTLIHKLVDEGMIQIVSPSRESETIFFDYLDLQIFARTEEFTAVIDRSIFTEMIYRYLDKKEPSTFDMLQMLTMFEKYNVKIVYCTNKDCFIKSIERGEDNITTLEQSKKVQELYSYLMYLLENFTDIDVIEYDYEKDTVYDILKKIYEEDY